MNAFEIILKEWKREFTELNTTPAFERLSKGDLTLNHYKSWLRETFHNARENPQLQAFATMYFKGKQRAIIKNFYQHAISEIGHDTMALNDLKTLGVDTTDIPTQYPLPTTTALSAFAYYQIQTHTPISYLGYLFHLEFMPTQNGHAYMKLLSSMGVPREAMTFLHEHSTVDIAHNKLMEKYIKTLVTTPEELESVIYTAKGTCKLYGHMVEGAFDNADNPKQWGKLYPDV